MSTNATAGTPTNGSHVTLAVVAGPPEPDRPEVKRWRVKAVEPSRSYGYDDKGTPADDPADVVRDLVTRVHTLRTAGRPVVLWIDKDFLVLSTEIPPKPTAPTPPPLEEKALTTFTGGKKSVRKHARSR